MIGELNRVAEAVQVAQTHLAECRKKMDPDHKHQDEVEDVDLGLKWIAKKITRIIIENSG